MLQNKWCHHEAGGCMHEYSVTVELYDNFVVKPKQSFAQPTQIFVFHWHFLDVLMTFTRIKTTYHNTNAVDRKFTEVYLICEVHM